MTDKKAVVKVTKLQILIPTDELDFPYVDDGDDPAVWNYDVVYEEDYDYYGQACMSCGKPHGEEEVFVKDGEKLVLCKSCVVIVTQKDMLKAWKELAGLKASRCNSTAWCACGDSLRAVEGQPGVFYCLGCDDTYELKKRGAVDVGKT